MGEIERLGDVVVEAYGERFGAMVYSLVSRDGDYGHFARLRNLAHAARSAEAVQYGHA